MAKAKNRHYKTEPPPNQKFFPCWPYWLSAHALIHAGAVALITDSITFGMVEFALHWITDFLKSEGWFNVNVDQAIHIGCKLIYALIILMTK
jgi:hypothetical protein